MSWKGNCNWRSSARVSWEQLDQCSYFINCEYIVDQLWVHYLQSMIVVHQIYTSIVTSLERTVKFTKCATRRGKHNYQPPGPCDVFGSSCSLGRPSNDSPDPSWRRSGQENTKNWHNQYALKQHGRVICAQKLEIRVKIKAILYCKIFD